MALHRPNRAHVAPVPTDSLSDIAFLLIIFFILTTSIQRVTGFTSEAPAAERASQTQVEKTPTVTIRNGSFTFNDQPVDIHQLRERLTRLNLPARKDSERIVVLEGADQVAYQDYFQVMAVISAAGGVVGIVGEEEATRR